MRAHSRVYNTHIRSRSRTHTRIRALFCFCGCKAASIATWLSASRRSCACVALRNRCVCVSAQDYACVRASVSSVVVKTALLSMSVMHRFLLRASVMHTSRVMKGQLERKLTHELRLPKREISLFGGLSARTQRATFDISPSLRRLITCVPCVCKIASFSFT